MKWVFAAMSLFLFSCASQKHGAHWDYSGLDSPDHWAELSGDYRPCRRGHHQSPVDLRSDRVLALNLPLEIRYHKTRAHIVNNGHTVEFDMDEANDIKVGDSVYQLIQLHFHADSEHTVNGKHFPAEMHLVHQSADGELAVIGILIEVGKSTLYDHIFDIIPEIGDSVETELHLEKFIPDNHTRFVYDGSLTTPPCTENVLWLVFEKHIRVPKYQLKKFKAFYSHNYRPTQNLELRQIYLVK